MATLVPVLFVINKLVTFEKNNNISRKYYEIYVIRR